MNNKVMPAKQMQEIGISYADARKAVESMNLIDGFLFDSSIENEEDAKVVIGAILRTVFDREIKEIRVTAQKQFQAFDTKYHGIRLDAHVTEEEDGKVSATIYDVEMENRIADKASLPKRLRFYNSLIDSRYLESGMNYNNLPNFVSITILSYDPFDAGDIYYEAGTVLTTHPDVEYMDGISHLYLYCNGKINESLSPSHGKRLMEVLKYIVSGEKINASNPEVNNLETVVSKIKKRPEVTKKYMQQWDRERILVQEAKDEGTEIGKEIGKEQSLIGLICKKLLKGKSVEIIASEVEEDEEYVKGICSVAEKYLPDYDVEKIYEEWKQ
ncbi:Rpn family recombination-promoting nuclease/putative transposase [Butyrivibrio sp. XPD2006]|uniref:Rpn family recombination-promoting nuclease/putative transposase n=1 Tax=Butyrivibrio sp. XPD2006 TaxID=1280668 RepID=UPI0003B651B4|nr:Rpn family recombination-promoting nuclease/putative transposase [Butyrivibrio sp. XPD2006]